LPAGDRRAPHVRGDDVLDPGEVLGQVVLERLLDHCGEVVVVVSRSGRGTVAR
jgi:archaellum component FlaG (FlaF/FlaG flagellin family)